MDNGDVTKGDIEPYPIRDSLENKMLMEEEVSYDSVAPLEKVDPQEAVNPLAKVDPQEIVKSLEKVDPQEKVELKKTLVPASATMTIENQGEKPQSEVVPPVLEDRVVVRFNYNTNDFTDQGLKDLNSFAASLASYPKAMVSIKGYTDSYGNEAYNRKLSEFRANIVKSYLLGKGARREQMEAKGLGNDSPIETNDSNLGRKINRRVEIEVISRGEPLIHKQGE